MSSSPGAWLSPERVSQESTRWKPFRIKPWKEHSRVWAETWAQPGDWLAAEARSCLELEEDVCGMSRGGGGLSCVDVQLLRSRARAVGREGYQEQWG